ncbi:pumilio domain member 6 [Serendipita sp. 399]|nr:pumilio domain member 6 [Serendipita sp. 399]
MERANSRKRPSTHQPGKNTKKRNIVDEAPKRKSIPVTATRIEPEESEDELSESRQEDNEELADELGNTTIHDGIKGAKGAAFESHKAQKELLAQRKAAKPNAEMVIEAKILWNSARQRNLSKQEREAICKTLADTFLVLKLVRYCPKHRSSLLSEFHGNVLRLLLHREAGHVISDSFELYSNANERAMLLREFYGKEVALFEPKKEGNQGLRGVLDGLEKERQRRILSNLKENIQSIFENSDKGAVSHAIVHAALWEYLSEIELLDDKAEAERLRREIYEICQESVAEMVHTKHGSQSVRYFLAYGTAKDRKQITKLLKPHLERICLDSEAQLVLFTLLDVTDDTKLLAKSVLIDLATLASKLYMDANGRRALLYPLIYRSSRHITPAMATTLASTDSIRASTSKKDDDLRREEVRKAFSGDILNQVQLHAAKMIVDPGGSLLVTEVLLYADGDKLAAVEAVLRPLQSPFPGNMEQKHPVELSHTSRMLKQLLQGGHWSHATKAVARSEHFDAAIFSSAFLRIVGDDDDGQRIRNMAQGDGTFVVAELCERIEKEGRAEDKRKLKKWFPSGLINDIKNSDIRGGAVLLEKLVALRA